MKLTVTTSLLQNMVAKSMKGASCNKMIPITSLMLIQLKDHVLTLLTTDATNYLYVREEKVDGDDFYVVVQAEMFSKLISRLTCETVTLELKENSLNVKGNGNYSIELPLNEEGELIVYPDPLNKIVDGEPTIHVNLSTLRLILATAKASLADTNEVPCYTGYYVGDSVVSTDTYKICGISVHLFDEPALISSEMMDLLDLLTEEDVGVYRKGNIIVFSTSGCDVYGKLMDDIDDFQIDVIGRLLNQEFESKCKVSKDSLLQLLDRLSLFVSAYDKNGIYLTFTREGLQIDSKQANSSEILPYLESTNFKNFLCCIDIEMLRSQIKAHAGNSIEIQYGEDNAIKIVDGNITQIIALLEDDRL